MSGRILGIGTANPVHPLSKADATEMLRRLCAGDAKQERLAGAMVRLTGVDQRQTCVPFELAYEWQYEPDGPRLSERMQLYEQYAAPLAIESATKALENADVPPQAVTHLVTVSCTGLEAPGVDIRLIKSLGMPNTTERVNVGFMGCQASINALRVAQGLMAADAHAVVLVVATELCSLHYSYGWKPDQMVGNVIFGDGSAAVVLGNRESTETTGNCQWQLQATGSQLVTESESQMSWRIRDFGFEMILTQELPQTIETHLRGWLVHWLASHGRSLDQIKSWAIHPGGPKILDAAEKALGLPRSTTAASRQVFREHGNMSSPTMLFVIERLREEEIASPCVALAFGPGITAEAVLFD